jgi:hypothetical protein
VVLPALVVLVLVAVVAIASTGSTPSGSAETRPPADSLLDALFSLGLVAVVAGALLLLYGLTQRKAIAREVASGRYGRTSLLLYLLFVAAFMGFAYWRRRHPALSAEEPEEGDLPFAGERVARVVRPRPRSTYEADVSWLVIGVVVSLVVVAGIAYVVAERRTSNRRRAGVVLAEQLAVVLDEMLDDLRAEPDPRRAIIAAYARLERVLAANGIPRRAAETSDEYLARVLRELELDSGAVERLTRLFTRAKFSQHDVDNAMKEEAIGALELVRDELRLAQKRRESALEDATTPAGADA